MMKRLLSEEKGQSMVLISTFLLVLVGFAGLAIDGGRIYLAKSNLQKAVDAGALAGANVLATARAKGEIDYAKVNTAVRDTAEQNYATGEYQYDSTIYKENSVEVTGNETIRLMLMGLFLENSSRVISESAKVDIGPVGTVKSGVIIPIGVQFDVDQLSHGDPWELTSKPGSNKGPNKDIKRGNYGFLDFSVLEPPGSEVDPNSGTGSVDYYILNGSPAPISYEQELITRTGSFVNALKNLVPNQIVYVPIVTGFDFTKGPGDSETTVTVLGFAAFQLSNPPVSGNTINGTFIGTVLPGEIGETEIDGGIYTTELVD